MENGEFEKIWRLMGSLWPNAAAKKGRVDKAVWLKGLEPYEMADVSGAILTYAQGNKFFPDMADVTKHLQKRQTNGEKAILHNAKVYAKIKGVEPPPFETKDEALAWAREMEEMA